LCYALSVSTLALNGVGIFGQNGARATKKREKNVAKMVDAIANRNKPPNFVKTPSDSFKETPLFPKSYNWREDERVLKALNQLHKDMRVELWEELVRKSEDPRYSLTTKDKAENAVNRSVGRFCRDLANWRLHGVYEHHLPDDENSIKEGAKINLGIEHPRSLLEWRKKNKGKSLYQLQIELCELAVTRLAKVKGISQEQKDSTLRKIKAEITKLRKTKRPIFLESNVAGLEVYDAEEAMKIRKQLGHKE
jgi:hypothetical protein